MRALIALFLILVFVLFGVYLFRMVAAPSATTKLSGLTAAQIAELDQESVVAVIPLQQSVETFDVNVRAGDALTPTTVLLLPGLTAAQVAELDQENVVNSTPGEPLQTFDVEIRAPVPEEGARLAQQLMTTVGTLVVAVAGFYFGTRAVATARGVAVPFLPVVRKIEPDHGEQGKEVPVDIFGENFQSPMIVKLCQDSDEIQGTDITWSTTRIKCKFNIPGDAGMTKKWDLIVMNEDGGEDRLPESFAVVEARKAKVPDVVKKGETTKAEAAELLEAEGLEPNWDPADDAADDWVVVSQDPPKEQEVAKGSEVTVRLKQTRT